MTYPALSQARNGKRHERGYILIVALLAVGFISSVSLVFVQYANWQSQLVHTESTLHRLHQAQEASDYRVQNYLKNTLSDSNVIENRTIEYDLPPNITVESKIRSLNSKINVNRLKKGGSKESFQRLVGTLLDELNYPERTMAELKRWISSENEFRGGKSDRYGGYQYSAPHRKLLHLDEVGLISGFKEIGLKQEFQNIFTVYGSGSINPLHFTPEKWNMVSKAFPDSVEPLPARALRSSGSLRTYLKEDSNWNQISDEIAYFKRKDDSFRVDTQLKQNSVQLNMRSIYTYDDEKKKINLKTQFTINSTDF